MSLLTGKGRAFGAGKWVAWVLVWCDATDVVWASSRVWRSGVSLICISSPDRGMHRDPTNTAAQDVILLLNEIICSSHEFNKDNIDFLSRVSLVGLNEDIIHACLSTQPFDVIPTVTSTPIITFRLQHRFRATNG